MDEGIYTIRPIYRKGVKISDWFEDYLQYPLDFPNPKNGSHYKTLGPTDEFFIPKTTAKEAMEQGRQIPKEIMKGVGRSIVNFTSYPLIDNDRIFGNVKDYGFVEQRKVNVGKLLTTYQRSYCTKKVEDFKHKRDCCQDEILHPLFNRKPKNDFELACKSSENKFMDDHFFNPSEARKCNNFLKQMRNVTFIPWLGVYQ